MRSWKLDFLGSLIVSLVLAQSLPHPNLLLCITRICTKSQVYKLLLTMAFLSQEHLLRAHMAGTSTIRNHECLLLKPL